MACSKILVRAANSVGDAVLSLPALRAIQDANPQARIAVLARPWVAGLTAANPSVTNTWRSRARGADGSASPARFAGAASTPPPAPLSAPPESAAGWAPSGAAHWSLYRAPG
ncbi:MAG: hypothetical protein ABSH05_25810 [Bryobacteraceae bacterium]